MNTASVAEIKKELSFSNPDELVSLCLRLARFKKENKELLSYLLFEKQDEDAFVEKIKAETDDLFDGINYSHLYYAKKSLRKILRIINKYTRYSGEATTEASLRIHFCQQLKDSPLNMNADKTLKKIYTGQVEKLHKIIGGMHEDLQYDYLKITKSL